MNVKKSVRALLCLYLTLIIATDAVKGQSLKVGDTLPPELWSMPLDVINHPEGKETLTLSDYKDKLIILDFWATWCSPCIAMLPKQDSLQRQFKDQLQILPVTYQTGEEVSTFMQKYEKRKGVKNGLPKVVNNQSLKPYFQHGTLPHYIWIKDGTVQAITGYSEVNRDQISAALTNQNLRLKTKAEIPSLKYETATSSLSTFLSQHEGMSQNKIEYRSLLSRHLPGLGSGRISVIQPSERSPQWRITFTNSSILELYRFAFGEGINFTNSGTIAVETCDSIHFKPRNNRNEFKSWIEENTYCYELELGGFRAGYAFEIMRQELKTRFPQYQGGVEKRLRKVWALVKTNDTILPVSDFAEFSESYDNFTYNIKGSTPETFVNGLNMYLSGISQPIIDATGISHKIDLKIEASLGKIEELNHALLKYGLALVEQTTEIPVLVIKDTASTTNP
jgi:thiol-disulfide isomerase/thioredoxin